MEETLRQAWQSGRVLKAEVELIQGPLGGKVKAEAENGDCGWFEVSTGKVSTVSRDPTLSKGLWGVPMLQGDTIAR